MTRVVTLLPAGTEIVAALGGGSALVGISHECDYPPSALALPRVTSTPIDPDAPGVEIDAQVRALLEAGEPVIAVDAERLRDLAPDLVVTQSLCEVCAVADGRVRQLREVLPADTRILALTGTTVAGVEADIRAVAEALDLAPEAEELVAGMQYRLRRLRSAHPARPPRVACVEWLDPLYLAGHWVPELVAAAGGIDVGAAPGEKSLRRSWAEVVTRRPDLLLVMLCGFSLERARQEWAAFARSNPGFIALLGATPVRFVDGNAYTSRPGPRLVEGAEKMAVAIWGGSSEQ